MPIARMIRKMYPGVYDDLSDAQLEQKVAKAPGAVRLKLARAEMDVRAQASARDRGLDDPRSPEFQALRAEGERKGTAEAAGPTVGILGSALGLEALGMGAAGLAGAARGIPVVGKALQFATTRPGAAAIGAVEEGYRTGSPIEAAKGALLGAALGRSRGPIGRAISTAEDVAPIAKSARTVLAAPAAAPVAVPSVEAIRGAAQTARAEALASGATAAQAQEAAAAAATAAVRGEAVATAKVLPKGQRAMATNLGGKAKPGPPTTPPDEVAAKLQESIAANAKKVDTSPGAIRSAQHAAEKAVEKAAAETSDLAAPRIRIGAEKVGRQVGMTKEQVRTVAGPVVGEARGAASPVFPQTTFDDIYDTMLAMPRGGIERKAYAAAAKGEKAMTQVETIRRVFERAGMVVPIAAIGEAIRRREGEE